MDGQTGNRELDANLCCPRNGKRWPVRPAGSPKSHCDGFMARQVDSIIASPDTGQGK
jgi:hypothetical protein